jgi:hypothetical protein
VANRLLFHGTVHFFENPDLSKCKDRKDFGRGFYLSDDINHSKSLAKGRLMNPTVKSYLYSYRVDIEDAIKYGLNVHKFDRPNYEWLDYISNNRTLQTVEEYDIVIGPTADAAAQKIIMNYCVSDRSNKDKDNAIRELNALKYGTQYCFKTEKAIEYLNTTFVERREFV